MVATADTPVNVGATSPGFTPQSFADALLAGIGAPVNPVNETFVEKWISREGGHWKNSAMFNPLDTSKVAYGDVADYAGRVMRVPVSKNYRSGQPGGGVQAYPDAQTGIAATVATLELPYYKDVVAGLKASDPNATEAAIIASPWDATHYGYQTGTITGASPAQGGPGKVQNAISGGTVEASTPQASNAPGILKAINSALDPGLSAISPVSVGKDIIARGAVVFVGLICTTAGLITVVSAIGRKPLQVASAVPGAAPAASTIAKVAL